MKHFTEVCGIKDCNNPIKSKYHRVVSLNQKDDHKVEITSHLCPECYGRVKDKILTGTYFSAGCKDD